MRSPTEPTRRIKLDTRRRTGKFIMASLSDHRPVQFRLAASSRADPMTGTSLPGTCRALPRGLRCSFAGHAPCRHRPVEGHPPACGVSLYGFGLSSLTPIEPSRSTNAFRTWIVPSSLGLIGRAQERGRQGANRRGNGGAIRLKAANGKVRNTPLYPPLSGRAAAFSARPLMRAQSCALPYRPTDIGLGRDGGTSFLQGAR
jgi:hypothetical protein